MTAGGHPEASNAEGAEIARLTKEAQAKTPALEEAMGDGEAGVEGGEDRQEAGPE